jgi:hypothetical protein
VRPVVLGSCLEDLQGSAREHLGRRVAPVFND